MFVQRNLPFQRVATGGSLELPKSLQKFKLMALFHGSHLVYEIDSSFFV